jgi:hypothetical protein
MEVFSEGETHIGQVCEEVLDICLAKGSRDNMSAVIVAFDALKIGKGKVCCVVVYCYSLYIHSFAYGIACILLSAAAQQRMQQLLHPNSSVPVDSALYAR